MCGWGLGIIFKRICFIYFFLKYFYYRCVVEFGMKEVLGDVICGNIFGNILVRILL